MNKLNNEALKVMNTRTKTGIFIGLYCTLAFCFLYFSDNHGWNQDWFHFPNDNIVRFIFSLLFISSFGWMSFFIAKELDNCFLKTNKLITQMIIGLTLFIGQVAPTLVMFLNYYGITNIGQYVSMYIFLGMSFGVACITLVVGLILTTKYKNTKGLSLFFLPLILVGLVWSFEYIYYLGVIRSWTTLLVIIVGVFSCDIFAYFSGMFLGKHKLAPKISPKKSWEGMVIGCLLSVGLVVLILFLLSYSSHGSTLLFFGYGFLEQINYLWWISVVLIAIAIVVITVFGDLLFSWFKRINGIKDFGTLLPGHGGILDRLDSLLTVGTIIGAIMGLISFIFVFVNNDSSIFFPIG